MLARRLGDDNRFTAVEGSLSNGEKLCSIRRAFNLSSVRLTEFTLRRDTEILVLRLVVGRVREGLTCMYRVYVFD